MMTCVYTVYIVIYVHIFKCLLLNTYVWVPMLIIEEVPSRAVRRQSCWGHAAAW